MTAGCISRTLDITNYIYNTIIMENSVNQKNIVILAGDWKILSNNKYINPL